MQITAERRSISVDMPKDKLLDVITKSIDLMTENKLTLKSLLSSLGMDEVSGFGDDRRYVYDFRFELDYDEDDQYALLIDWRSAIK